MNKTDFMTQIGEVIRDFEISYCPERTSDRDARRIATLINDAYLRSVDTKDPNHTQYIAHILERQVYEGVRQMKLDCQATPEEERVANLRYDKKEGVNPLKLSAESQFKYQPEQSLKLADDVLNLLREVQNGQRGIKNRPDTKTVGSRKVLRGLKSNTL